MKIKLGQMLDGYKNWQKTGFPIVVTNDGVAMTLYVHYNPDESISIALINDHADISAELGALKGPVVPEYIFSQWKMRDFFGNMENENLPGIFFCADDGLAMMNLWPDKELSINLTSGCTRVKFGDKFLCLPIDPRKMPYIKPVCKVTKVCASKCNHACAGNCGGSGHCHGCC